MTLIVLTQASSGAPAMEGVNGSMNAVLNWALTHSSLGADAWAREFHNGPTNESIFRAASGNRLRLYVRHDSSASGGARRCVIRGCESASAYNARTDEFPTSAQVADTSSNWLASSTADGTDRNYIVLVAPTWVALFVRYNGTLWEMGFFGDVLGSESGDSYDTIAVVRNSTNEAAAVTASASVSNAPSSLAASPIFWARDISGAVKSTRGWFQTSGSQLGAVANAPAMKGGYNNAVRREKIAIGCSGSSTTSVGSMTMMRRGWLPNIWQPLHSGLGGIPSEDTGTDTPYSASALFRILETISGSALIVEESDTYSAPSG